MIPRGKLTTRLTVERPVADPAFDGAGYGEWAFVRKVWAEVEDALPSRGEREDGGFVVNTGRARVRIDPCTDIDASMRFVAGSRIMTIVSGPAKVNNPQATEFMVENYSSAGGGA